MYTATPTKPDVIDLQRRLHMHQLSEAQIASYVS